MLTRFVSDSAWGAPEYVYPYDDTVSLKNSKLYVAGNMNINFSPFLENLQDFQNNNYSTLYLTEKKALSSILEVEIPKLPDTRGSTGMLGVYLENGLVKENTRFLECLPLYRHANDFSITFADFYNLYTGLSGASLIFSSVNPALTTFEIGFSINGQTPIFNGDRISSNYIANINTNMQTAAHAVSSKILEFNFCQYLSGFVNNFSVPQTIKISISSRSNEWNSANLKGVSLVLGNVKLGALSADAINFYRRFVLRFNIDGQLYTPQGYNVNEYYTIKNPILPPPLNSSSEIFTVLDSLTSVFDPNRVGNEYSPVSKFFGVKDVKYDIRGFEITVFNRLSGSVIETPKILNGFDNQGNILSLQTIQEGKDSGFHLQFKRIQQPITVNFDLPDFYSSYNTFFSLTSLSLFDLDQYSNDKEYFYTPEFVPLLGENNNLFLDINFLNDSELVITHSLYRRKAYLVSDDLNKKLSFIDSKYISDSNLALAKFNYVYDKITNRIIIYKTINGSIYALSENVGELVYVLVFSLADISESSIFDIIRFNAVNTDFEKSVWGSYQQSLNTNNLNLDEDRSFNVKNNFLLHSEYSNSESNIHINIIPLKNQLNEFHRVGRRKSGVDFRDYHSIYTGDNNEQGNSHISLGYLTNNKEYIFKSGNITWFHIPYNETLKRININDANFVLNGAIPGQSPVFSDKIFKKMGSYRTKSNLGDSRKEQTGQWLCSWLSGGDDGTTAVWVDRFYNPEIITEIEAIKITNNVEYIPSYSSKNYQAGITDKRSSLTIEPGVWYAYYHVGKTDNKKLISYLKRDLVQEGLIGTNLAPVGEYNFAGDTSGYVSIKNYESPLNQFTFSFFGHSLNWEKPMGNQLMGNYLDSGFGIFNFKEILPFTYYFNKNKLFVYNTDNIEVLTTTVPASLSGNIVGLFRRNFGENFHVILDTLDVLEYSLEGTLVDLLPRENVFPDPPQKRVISTANNYNFGVILFHDLSYTTVDLKTNVAKHYGILENATALGVDNPAATFCVFIDQSNFVYIIDGRQPILREDKLYYIDSREPRHLKVYNTITRETATYIDASKLEKPPLNSITQVRYRAQDTTVLLNPYSTFNLRNLSGFGMTFYPANNKIYSLGLSVYKQKPIFYDPVSNNPGYIPEHPITVDLNGNYWYERDKVTRERLDEVYFADKLGFTNKVCPENSVFTGDPYYNERLGATDRRFGVVFVNKIDEGYKIKNVAKLDVGPQPARSKIYYAAFYEGQSLQTAISSFPLSGNITFFNGTDIYSHPYGESTYGAYMSALSLAFTVDGSTPYHPDKSILTKFTANLTTPLTSIDILTNQLTRIFNSNIVPHPNTGLYPNNIPLSAFIDFKITEKSDILFEMEIKNRFAGETPLVVQLPTQPVGDTVAKVILPFENNFELAVNGTLNSRNTYGNVLVNGGYRFYLYFINSTERRWILEFYDFNNALVGAWRTNDFPPGYSGYPWQSGVFTRYIGSQYLPFFEVYKEGTVLARKHIQFESYDPTPQNQSIYTSTLQKPGTEAVGQNGERFGWKVLATPFATNSILFRPGMYKFLAISSPEYSSGGVSVGKVTVYQSVLIEPGQDLTFESYAEILSPRTTPGANFGYSMANYPWFFFSPEFNNRTKHNYVIIGAPATNSTDSPQSSAVAYDLAALTVKDLTRTLTFVGPTSSNFAFCVDVNHSFWATSSPEEYQTDTNSHGVVTLTNIPAIFYDRDRLIDSQGLPYDYRILGTDSPIFRDYTLRKGYELRIKPPRNRYRFGHAFKILDDNTVVVGSVGETEHGIGKPIIDIFKFDKLNPSYSLLSSFEIPFTITADPSAISIDIDATSDRIVAGAWTGSFEDFGDEYGVVNIWYKVGDQYYFVYDQKVDNTNPLIFKQFLGRSVSITDDRLITGTSFIYNTGNSALYAVSAINTALERQTLGEAAPNKSLFTCSINKFDPGSFTTTIVTNISGEDVRRPNINIENTLKRNNTIEYVIEEYFKGSTVLYSGKIIGYNFTVDEETHLLTDFYNIKSYNTLGEFKSESNLYQLGLTPLLSCIRFGINNLLANQSVVETFSFLAVDRDNIVHKVAFTPQLNTLEQDIIDTNGGNQFFYPINDQTFESVTKRSFDITNSSFGNSLIRLTNSIPSISFKLRLNNRLDQEQSEIFEPQYSCENMSRGWHHFAIVLDTVNGTYKGYMDAKQIFNFSFRPGKYTFSQILKNNIIVGATPYFNNTLFDNFYKSRKSRFFTKGLKLDEIRFYNRPLTQQEIRTLTYSKFEPDDLKLQLDFGYRNYLDIITRSSRHKKPGIKSGFIDIHINDSLITDPSLQKYYETKLLMELKNYLPSYVRINKFVWGVNKPADTKILEGDINVGNTLTDSGGIND